MESSEKRLLEAILRGSGEARNPEEEEAFWRWQRQIDGEELWERLQEAMLGGDDDESGHPPPPSTVRHEADKAGLS